MFSHRTSAGALRGLARPQARCPRWQCSSSSRASFASSSTAHAQSSHSFATAGTRQRLAWGAGLAGIGASLYGYNLHLSSSHSNALSLDSDSLPNTAPLAAKRASYSDRIKAHKGGPIEIIRARERQEDIEQEHDVENSAESHSANFANLEEEAAAESGQEGAFDPVTGKLNWDCPCLGGMAYGPCGEQFKKSFSCFVFSETEPKGKDCIDSFVEMQACFREHPEVYAEELKDDEWDEAQEASGAAGGGAGAGAVLDNDSGTAEGASATA